MNEGSLKVALSNRDGRSLALFKAEIAQNAFILVVFSDDHPSVFDIEYIDRTDSDTLSALFRTQALIADLNSDEDPHRLLAI